MSQALQATRESPNRVTRLPCSTASGKDSAYQVTTMTPQPISTAPHEEDAPLLLFCPEQGGWHTGVWFLGKWLAYIDTSVVLQPSHWLPIPPEPFSDE
jgi:hypothetical protein